MAKVKTNEELLVNFYKKNISKGKSFVVNHFIGCGYKRSTAYRMVDKCESGSLKRKVGSGRTAKISTAKNVQKIDSFFRNKSGCSQRGVAKKFNCSQSLISKVLSQKTDIRCFKKKRRPNRKPNQLKEMRPNAESYTTNIRIMIF